MIGHYISMLIIGLTLRDVICRSFAAEEGPFEVVVHNTSNCIQEQPWFRSNVTAHSSRGHSILRGAIVIEKAVKNVKYHIRLYYLDGNNVKVKALEIKNVNCRNVVVQMVLTTIGAKYDRRKCSMSPNTWEFNNLDLDAVTHIVLPSMYYGLVQLRWEVFARSTPLMCLDINVEFVPRKDKVDKVLNAG